jgi:hypothetical protein
MKTVDSKQHGLELIEAQPDTIETRLREVESRGKTPYFVLSFDTFQQLCEAGDDGSIYVWPAAIGNVLCVYRKSISEDVPDGLNVILPLANKGATSCRIRTETSLKDCVLCQEPDLNSGSRRIFLRYRYERALHGTPATLKLTFKSSDGHKSTHTYKTVHGEFVFERVDPR